MLFRGKFLSVLSFSRFIHRQSTVRKFSSMSVVSENIVSSWIEKDKDLEYLKEVEGVEAIKWVKSESEHCIKTIGNPTESPLYNKILSILDSNEKIPHVRKIQDYYYNFWQDKSNPRGLWRRTSLDSYKSVSPVWETVLDFDQLGKDEGESWVYKGHTLYENSVADTKAGIQHNRTLLSLSRGGSDAVVIREFDLASKSFVTDGFVLPEAKSRVHWKTIDLLLVGTDLHDGESMTDSGYPRVVREWVRGTPLEASTVVFEGEKSDVSVSAYVSKHRNYSYELRSRSLTFYTSQYWLLVEGKWCSLAVQKDAEVDQFADNLLVKLRSDWVIDEHKTYLQGSLLAVNVKDFVANHKNAAFCVLFEPTATASLETYAVLKDYLVLETLDTVKSRYLFWRYNTAATSPAESWSLVGQEQDAVIRGSSISAVDGDESNQYWLTTSSFINPTSLSLGDADQGVAGIVGAERLKSLPSMFDAEGLVEKQHTATSADGTKVPYFIIHHADMPLDGTTPTLLYGYGGFEISLTPTYSAVIGATWLNRQANGHSSCYVYANIRGGGEFGPSWHQAALRENRKLAYDDFIAVAEDLVARKITSSHRLGIRGGSNGGLLMGNMMVRRPDLFGAISCAVPLLDMRCYHKLLAGASWMAEYGDPDKPEDWEFLQKYSAFHNINAEEVRAGKYPPLLMTTSTKDDRVHPYHARCFVKRLLDIHGTEAAGSTDGGNKEVDNGVYYYENMEGGHGGAADNKQQAFVSVLYLEFLKKTICPKN